MDHAYESTTVEMDKGGFADLQDQLINNKVNKPEIEDIRNKAAPTDNKRNAPISS